MTATSFNQNAVYTCGTCGRMVIQDELLFWTDVDPEIFDAPQSAGGTKCYPIGDSIEQQLRHYPTVPLSGGRVTVL